MIFGTMKSSLDALQDRAATSTFLWSFEDNVENLNLLHRRKHPIKLLDRSALSQGRCVLHPEALHCFSLFGQVFKRGMVSERLLKYT